MKSGNRNSCENNGRAWLNTLRKQKKMVSSSLPLTKRSRNKDNAKHPKITKMF